jgi:thiosulfate dehydrogenase
MKPGHESNEKSGAAGEKLMRRQKHKIAITLLSILAIAVVVLMIWAPEVATWIRRESRPSERAPKNALAAAEIALMAPSAAQLRKGHLLFQRDCLSCHGQNGDGISHVSRTLHPKPFDLRSFQLSGSYISHVLEGGIPGTDMPAWHSYSPGELQLVTAYTATLGRPDYLPEADRFAPPAALAEAGRRVYTMHCVRCHGEKGDGNGPEAKRHKPLPASFVQMRPSYAIARRIIENGVAGTDMAAWPLLTPGEVQSVTYYIRSLYTGSQPAVVETQLSTPARPKGPEAVSITWPALNLASMPEGSRGESIRLGMDAFLETPKYASAYVGNQLSCGDCHLQAGTAPYGSPIIGAPSWFPAYSRRAGRMISLKDRIQECFTRSENGRPLPYDSPQMNGLVAFMEWVSEGKPSARASTGRGLEKLPALKGNPSRGAEIFTKNCSGCHGADGAGVPPIIPPLWGPGSYNAGAGMDRVGQMAAFVQRNMPQNHPKSLSAQQAYDVSAYVATKPHVPFNPAYAKY